MKKHLLLCLSLSLAIAKLSYAGLISHTDYTSGGVITAAGQNANENAIFNEFNGNIDNNNIKSGGILSANIAAGTIAADRLVTAVQNTLTYMPKYRRPNLQWVSVSTITAESGLDGTSGDVVIMFPDGNVRTDSTALRVNCNVALTAANSGVAQGGIRTGSIATATWYAVYAVKTTDNSSNFVLIADTVLPTQANYATLNTNFGTNGWVYLGLIKTGLSAANIINFTQVGNRTLFTANGNTSGAYFDANGIKMATGSPVTSVAWGYNVGTSSAAVANNITNAIWTFGSNTNAGVVSFLDYANARLYARFQTASTGGIGTIELPASIGFTEVAGSSAMDVWMTGFVDGALSQNSQL